MRPCFTTLSPQSGEPVLGFLVGAMLGWMCHSTLAVVLLIASLLVSGSLEIAGAVPLILGVNFGGPPSQRRWTSLRRLDGCLWRTCFAAGSPHSP